MSHERITVLVDDLRSFRDDRPAVVFRTSVEMLTFLQNAESKGETLLLKELWLDHDLGPGDDIRKVTLLLEERAFNGDPLDVEQVFVHSANPPAADSIVQGLRRWGYNARRASCDPLISAPIPD